jgi:hypothetical protein
MICSRSHLPGKAAADKTGAGGFRSGGPHAVSGGVAVAKDLSPATGWQSPCAAQAVANGKQKRSGVGARRPAAEGLAASSIAP